MILLKPVLTKEEINDTACLARTIWQEHFTPIIGAKQVAYMLEKFQSAHAIGHQIKHGYLYYALVSDDQQIGYTSFRIDEDALFLSKLYIHKDFRGNGYSHPALDKIVELAKKTKKSVIRLTCNKNNFNSLAAYKKLGFQIVRQEKTDIGEGFFMDDYILEKRI